MTAGSIQNEQTESLNKARRPMSAGRKAFAEQLAAQQAAPAPLDPLQKQFEPLYSSDFLGGNSFFSSKPASLKALNGIDFSGAAGVQMKGASQLLPLDDEDARVPSSKSAPTDQHGKMVQQAQKWVAQTFYGTMLKQMREGPFSSGILDGGKSGKAFASLLDQHLADHMARGAGSKLVNSIVKGIEKNIKRPGASGKGQATENPFQNVRIHVAPSLGR